MNRKPVVVLLCSVVILAGSSREGVAQGTQFFNDDVLPFIVDAVWYATFMQHSWASGAQYDTLHSGIDVSGLEGDAVYSANDYWDHSDKRRAQVVAVDRSSNQVMIAKMDRDATQAILLAHVVPTDSVHVGDILKWSTSVGTLAANNHVHAELYKWFHSDNLWASYHPTWVPQDPINTLFLKDYLVNPVRHAFETANWIDDNVDPAITESIAWRDSIAQECAVIFRAHDFNDRLENCCSWPWGPDDCKAGIFTAELRIDGMLEDFFEFKKFEGKLGVGPISAGMFYLNGDSPPGGCNQGDSLTYYLVWSPCDADSHDVRLEVCDAAGNCTTETLRWPTSASSWVHLNCELKGSQVIVRWNVPDTWTMPDFHLYRSSDTQEMGIRINGGPITAMAGQDGPKLEFEFRDDVPSSLHWESLSYTLEGTVDDGSRRKVGSGVVVNSLSFDGEIRLSPNPFVEEIRIEFRNPTQGRVTIGLYDVSGRLVREVERTQLPKGRISRYWDGRNIRGQRVSPGVYFLTVASERHVQVEKIILAR